MGRMVARAGSILPDGDLATDFGVGANRQIAAGPFWPAWPFLLLLIPVTSPTTLYLPRAMADYLEVQYCAMLRPSSMAIVTRLTSRS